jgi:hypothetical protein
MIRIDVHHIWENLIHTTCALLVPVHIRHSYAPYGQSLYVTTFHADPTEFNGCTAPEKKWSWLYLSVRLSGLWDSPKFLSQDNHWSSALKPSMCWRTGYISLLSPYLQHVISTFNTCSRGSTHRSLTDIDGGYNLGGACLPHHTPRLPNQWSSAFP